MKTFLVPTDFSDTAKNAAQYALHFSESIPGSRVVLFHTYDKHAYGSDGTPLQVDEVTERNIAMAALANHRADLLSGGSSASVEIIAHGGDFTEWLEQSVEELKVDLIIMGINESNALDQFLLGSATLRLIKKHICPVMIIPENLDFEQIGKIAYASDLEDIEHTTPVSLLRYLCSTFKTNINVVHVGGYYNPDERAALALKLEDCQPEFHFLDGKEFARPLNHFAETNGVNLLVMVSRQHDFFERLFKKSHTQIMAYHSTVPILAVHESLCDVQIG